MSSVEDTSQPFVIFHSDTNEDVSYGTSLQIAELERSRSRLGLAFNGAELPKEVIGLRCLCILVTASRLFDLIYIPVPIINPHG